MVYLKIFPIKSGIFKELDKYESVTDNQRKLLISMLCTMTENLDYVLEVLLSDVIFLTTKDVFRIFWKHFLFL